MCLNFYNFNIIMGCLFLVMREVQTLKGQACEGLRGVGRGTYPPHHIPDHLKQRRLRKNITFFFGKSSRSILRYE